MVFQRESNQTVKQEKQVYTARVVAKGISPLVKVKAEKIAKNIMPNSVKAEIIVRWR